MKWYCIFICLTYHGWLDSCLMPYNLRYRTWWSWPPFCIQPTSSINCLISPYLLIWDFLYAPQQYALMFGLSYLNHLDMSSWYEHSLQSICILQHSPIYVWFIHVLIFVTVSKCRKSPKLTNIVIYANWYILCSSSLPCIPPPLKIKPLFVVICYSMKQLPPSQKNVSGSGPTVFHIAGPIRIQIPFDVSLGGVLY